MNNYSGGGGEGGSEGNDLLSSHLFVLLNYQELKWIFKKNSGISFLINLQLHIMQY